MACPHASGCPLFPYLNASLGAWRVSYCDSADGWRGCARFVLSGQGKPVPLALLPNGRMPVAMLPSTEAGQSLAISHDLHNGDAQTARRILPPAERRRPTRPAPVPFGGVVGGPRDGVTARVTSQATRPRTHVVDLTDQSWSPPQRRSRWERLKAWLGEPL